MSEPAPPDSPTTTPRANPDRVPWYLWPNLLSLDAVTVALVWLWCFSVCEHVPILRPIYLVLGLVVWFVYTGDRLLDAMRMKDFAKSTPRHRFARRFFLPLLVMCLAALVCAVWLVLHKVPFALVPRGLLIALVVIIYFIFRLIPKGDAQVLLPKEVFCGIVFALGVTFPIHELPNNFVAGVLSAESILFVLLCILNCVVISVWEWEEDEANDKGLSIVQNWPGVGRNYMKIAFLLAGVAAFLGVRGLPDFLAPILLSVALSAAIIGAIGLAEGVLSKNLRRVLADVALLSPLVVIPLLT